MDNIDLSSVAIQCSNRVEAESAIQYFIDGGYPLSDLWKDIGDLAKEWYKFTYAAINRDNKNVTLYSRILPTDNKTVFLYSEFVSNHVKCADYDMIL